MKRTAFLRKPEAKARLEVPVDECDVCGQGFIKRTTLHTVCSPKCLLKKEQAKEKAEALRAKAERAADRKKREALKTRSDYIKEAQREFNRFIRLRDRDHPCICCGVALGFDVVGGAFDCGHYRSVGSAPHLRFHEDNAHGQRKQCNRYGAGRAVDYRLGLIARIGLARVEALEADQAPKHYSIEDLKAIKTKYRQMANELEKRNG